MSILDFTIAQNEKKRQVISDGSAKSQLSRSERDCAETSPLRRT
jgi:hypothetical protein